MRYIRFLQSGACGCLLGMMLVFPEAAARSAQNALSLFAQSVLPSLLPFSIFALLLTAGKRLSGAAIVGLSLLGGAPMGSRLFEGAALTKRQARRYAVMTGGLGPMFFLFTLSAWLQNAHAARLIYASQLLSALLCGLLLRGKQETARFSLPPLTLAQAVSQGALSMLSVGACIALGAVIPALLACTLPLSASTRAALWALCEVTGGCRAIIELQPPFTLPLLAAATGLGGFSLLLQTASGWQKHGLTLPQLFPLALLRAALAGALALGGYVTFF